MIGGPPIAADFKASGAKDDEGLTAAHSRGREQP